MDNFETAIKNLIKSARKAGSVTLAQLNDVLPEDASTPERIEQAMAMIEEAGLEILDGSEPPKKNQPKKGQKPREGEAFEGGPEEEALPEIETDIFATEKEPVEELTEADLAAPMVDVTEKIDDPVRMYLTQMGEIPLLTREEEISLARKIELTRKQFRKEVLSSGFGLADSIEILEDVVRGELAFDRTLKVNQQDPEIGKADLSNRLPGNIATLRLIYEATRRDFELLLKNHVKPVEAVRLKKQIFLRRRKA